MIKLFYDHYTFFIKVLLHHFYTPVWKTGCIMGTPAFRRPQGFCSLSQKVFIRSLSNLMNMLVCIMSWPSSITSQMPPGTLELWPFNCPKLGFPLSKSFCLVFIKLGKYILLGIIFQPSSIISQIPPCTPELWPLNCPLSKSKSFHQVYIKLGEYVGGHNISTKFYNLPNSPIPELWPLHCPKTEY